jgi:predicted transcriptional regulator
MSPLKKFTIHVVSQETPIEFRSQLKQFFEQNKNLSMGSKELMTAILIEAIDGKENGSVTELAKAVKRSNSDVAGFLTELEVAGLIKITFP